MRLRFASSSPRKLYLDARVDADLARGEERIDVFLSDPYAPAAHTYRRPNGSARAWRQLRKRILARDRWACVVYGAPATEVGHLVAVQDRGSDHPRNLRSLCPACHADSHRAGD